MIWFGFVKIRKHSDRSSLHVIVGSKIISPWVCHAASLLCFWFLVRVRLSWLSHVIGVQLRSYVLDSDLRFYCTCMRVFTAFLSISDTILAFALWSIEVRSVSLWLLQSC